MKKFLFLLIIPLVSFTTFHKYYVSVTDVNYSEKDQAVQVISKFFTDDLENMMDKRYGIKASLNSEYEHTNADKFINRYLKDKLKIYINGKEMDYKFLGKEYDLDLTKCYLEIPGIKPESLKSITITNTALSELFEDQQNIIHIDIKDQRKSFLLHTENDKAMLKF
ncbi:DUF6702 family protein [Robertkochia solimangrovi]|uniref:DUF6702 family protein n=1 Tax=Robertkochia solimangrovi TaxID=2213046 RepID=UPI00117C8FF9|nr:DUF6702 family protein [Robertkochia solimangrovi]TRZ41411.1 hypothetical protein DMZ48_17145 [Robertkochia solimangrovi]